MKILKKNLESKKFFFNKTKFFFLIFFLIFYILGIWSERYKFKNSIEEFFNDFIEIGSNKIFSKFYLADKFLIDIKYRDYQKILEDRNQGLKDFRVTDDSYQWVKAKLTFDGKKRDIKIKLKGVHEDHWNHPFKWSFKIKSEEGNIYGMKRFSIQSPSTRGYLFEWIFMKSLEYENLISHRIEFINPIINGNNYGIYLLEEQHSKELIENNKRREGPIIGFDKNLWIYEANNSDKLGANSLKESFLRSEISPVQFKDDQFGTQQEVYLNKAISLLSSFRKQELPLNEIFDIDQLAKVMALKAILGAIEFDWRDLKFYYNPITNLLEPIAREIHVDLNQSELNNWWVDSSSENFTHSPDQEYFLSLLYSDFQFYEKYLEQLSIMSKPDYLTKIINKNYKEYFKYKTLLKKNYPTAGIFSEEYIKKYQKIIANTLEPIQGININLIKINSKNKLELNVSNLQRLPVKVIGIEFDKKYFYLNNTEIISGKKINKNIENTFIEINCENKFCEKDNLKDVKILYKILGQNKIKSAKINFWNDSKKFVSFQKEKESLSSLKEFDFIKIKDDKIIISQGSWEIKKRLIIPKNYQLIIGPNTEIIFYESGQIISFSPIICIGSPAEKITIKTKYSKANNDNGNNILVLNTNEPSIFNHVIFSNLSAPKSNLGEGITGSINFYDADVRINNSLFQNNLFGDDFLNIINSNFSIKNSYFKEVIADAIDIDFGQGIIENLNILNTGNDGIDFSGSFAQLDNIFIEQAGDKGISLGENSKIIVQNLFVKNSRIGIASKDNSKLFANLIKLENLEIGIAAYQKKPEFGPGEIIVKDIIFENNKKNHMIQKNSKLNIDEREIPFYNCENKLIDCKIFYE